MSAAIGDQLKRFDGSHTAPLQALADAFEPDHAAFLTEVCLSSDARLAAAASWVIKRVSETGQADAFDWPVLFSVLERDPGWECALHLLQSAQHATVSPEPHQLRAYLDHKRVLLRVWALDAFVRRSLTDPHLQAEAQRRLAEALEAGPASLRARARALQKLPG